MKDNQDEVLRWIGLSEGGRVDHPKDPGGRTNRGITQATYDAWNARTGRPKRDVFGITKEEAEDIIVAQYMTPVMFDALPAGVDYAVADWSVNSGPARAVKELQKIVGADADGIMGSKTLAAVKRWDAQELILAYCNRRMEWLRTLGTFKTFGKGWTARVMGNRDGFQSDDIGVIDRAVMLARNVPVIPAPMVAAPAKADEADEKSTSILQRALADPVAVLPAVGAFITPIIDGSGPIQWAVAAAIVAGVAWALYRAMQRKEA